MMLSLRGNILDRPFKILCESMISSSTHDALSPFRGASSETFPWGLTSNDHVFSQGSDEVWKRCDALIYCSNTGWDEK